MEQAVEILDFEGFGSNGEDIRVVVIPTEGLRFDGDDEQQPEQEPA